MKKSPKLYLVVGLALLLAGLLAVYLTVAVGQSDNQVQRHVASGTISQATCASAGCHQAVLERTGYDAHNLHLRSGFGLAFFDKSGPGGEYDGCGKCHQSTDIREESGATLRKQVNAGMPGSRNSTLECLDCHGTFAKGTADPATKHAGVEWPAGSCGLALGNCHAPGAPKDPASAHAARTYINQMIAQGSAFCKKCHGGLDKYVAEETN